MKNIITYLLITVLLSCAVPQNYIQDQSVKEKPPIFKNVGIYLTKGIEMPYNLEISKLSAYPDSKKTTFEKFHFFLMEQFKIQLKTKYKLEVNEIETISINDLDETNVKLPTEVSAKVLIPKSIESFSKKYPEYECIVIINSMNFFSNGTTSSSSGRGSFGDINLKYDFTIISNKDQKVISQGRNTSSVTVVMSADKTQYVSLAKETINYLMSSINVK